MRIAWVFLLACLLSSAVDARGLTVEDVLANEQYTQVLPAPRAGVVLVGKTRPYTDAGDYRYDWFTRRVLSELWAYSPTKPGNLVRLLGGEAGTGYWAAGLSPSGRRVAVFRLRHDRLDLGVLDLARGDVRWLGVAPDMPYASPNPAWLDDDRLLLVSRPDRTLPVTLDYAFEPARRSPPAWSTTSKGIDPSVSVLGSGRMLGQRNRASPRDLIIYDIRTAAVRRLLQGDIADVLLSPDRRHAAIMRDDADLGVDQAHPADPADLTRAHRLDVLDLTTGRATPACSLCDVLPNLLAWSPSSAKLLFYARTAGSPWSDGALLVAAPGDGRVPAHAAAPFPRFAALIDPGVPGVITVHARWMGEQPALLGTPLAGLATTPRQVTDWYVPGPLGFMPLTAGAGPAALVLGTGPGQMTYLSNGRLLRGTPEARPRYLVPEEHVELAIERLDPLLEGTRRALNPDPAQTTLIARHGAKSTPIDLSVTGDVLQRRADVPSGVRITASLPEQNAMLVITSPNGGTSMLAQFSADRVTPVDAINRNLIDVVAVAPIILSASDENGQRLDHHLYLPPGQVSAAPLVVLPYPGLVHPAVAPAPDVATFNPTLNVQLLVAKGYAVLEPSMPTLAPAKDEASNPLDGITRQIEAAIRVAVAGGRIDRTRIAVYGHSYGGYAALAMATRGDLVRSVIAAAAPINLAAAYGVIDPRAKTQDGGLSTTIAFGWFEAGQGQLGGPPWSSPGRYMASSPLFRAGAMTVPVMLIQGEFDYMPVAGAEQMFMALYRQNKTAVLLRYAAEGHAIRSPANIRDQWRRVFAWLAEMDRPPNESAVTTGTQLGILPVADPGLDRRVDDQRSGKVAP